VGNLDFLSEIIGTITTIKSQALDKLGPLAPIVTGVGQIVAAAISLFLIIAGRGFFAPVTPGLSHYAVRVCGAVSGVGVVALYILSRRGTPWIFTVYAIYLIAAALIGAVVYLFLRRVLCFRCELDKTLYVRGLVLNQHAKRVLNNDLTGLPPQYDLHGDPPPTSTREYFCRSGKDPEFIWRLWSHALAEVILLVSYFFFIVPLTVGLASAAIAMTETEVRILETRETTRINVPTDVLFDFDKADLRPGAVASLAFVAEIFRRRGVSAARIEGHTDSVGDPKYNKTLSLKRAEAVLEWLKGSEGLGRVKFTVEGFGHTQPVANNRKPDGSDDPQGRQKNRRVVIVIDKQDERREGKTGTSWTSQTPVPHL